MGSELTIQLIQVKDIRAIKIRALYVLRFSLTLSLWNGVKIASWAMKTFPGIHRQNFAHNCFL